MKTHQQEGRCIINNGGIAGTINIRSLPNTGPIYRSPAILNNIYFPGAKCAFLGRTFCVDARPYLDFLPKTILCT